LQQAVAVFGEGRGVPYRVINAKADKPTAQKDNLDPLDAMASDIAKRDGISFEKAYGKALATAEGQKLYNQHVAKRMNPSV
jgi:hypothetical protein